jgi:hypothetical protein
MKPTLSSRGTVRLALGGEQGRRGDPDLAGSRTSRLLRGACPRAALRADPWARNDNGGGRGPSCRFLVGCPPALPTRRGRNYSRSAVPAHAGTHRSARRALEGWTPAFAGAAPFLYRISALIAFFLVSQLPPSPERSRASHDAWKTSVRSSMLSRGSTSAGAVGSSKAEWAVNRALSGAESKHFIKSASSTRISGT